MKSNRIKPKKLNESSKLDRKETTKLTTKNANGLASSGSDGKFVYLEGFAVGVCDVESGIRSRLVVSHRSPKTLICVESSRDGRFVAAGESGYQSAVLVWDCATQAFVYELKAHQYGISCIAFSPDGKYLVSVGAPQDGYICLWNLHGGVLVRKLRACFLSSAVASVCFSSDAKYIATAGKKHLKLWTIGSLKRSSVSTLVETLAMCRKPVKSGFLKESSFVCITSPGWINTAFACREQAREFFPIYALTDSGVLCLLNSELSVEKSVDLKVNKGFALSASNMLIACSCSAGVVKLFYVETLKYAGSFMYSERGKCHMENVKIPMDSEIMPSPDAIACQFSTSEKLVVVYGDHSFHIWNTHDAQKVDGGGCVFVWKVPNAFSSGMVHKMKENIGPSPARKAQISASSTSMLHEDTSDQCETKAEDISLLRSSNQVHESIHHEGARSVEISAFKFSISRLPKWAQDKLKNSETDTRCPLSTSSHQGDLKVLSPMVGDGGLCGPVCSEVQTTSEHTTECNETCLPSMSKSTPETDNSKISPTPPEKHRGFALDNRWVTVHTVCLDLLNTPQSSYLEETRKKDAAPKLLMDPERSKSSQQPRLFDSGGLYKLTDQTGSDGACHVAGFAKVRGKLKSSRRASRAQATEDDENCNLRSESRGLLSQQSDKLTSLKDMAKTMLSRRNNSAQVRMQDNHPRVVRRSFSSPVRDFSGQILNQEEMTSTRTVEDSQFQLPGKVEKTRSPIQLSKSSTENLVDQSCGLQCVSARSSVTDNLMDTELAKGSYHRKDSTCKVNQESLTVSPTCSMVDSRNGLAKAIDQKDRIEKSELQNKIISCQKALLNLNLTAEKALQSFFELRNLDSSADGISDQRKSQLYEEAVKLLPSIAEKVYAIAELVRLPGADSCKIVNVDVPNFEPLPETFAESLHKEL